MLKKALAALASAALTFSMAEIVHAQDGAGAYPTRPITVLAPFAPGGTVDIVARLVGQKLTAEFGQSVLVENRPGAGGTIATGQLARATPDGYTLMLQHMGLAFDAGLYSKLPYDPAAIVPVAYIGATPNVLVVPTNSPLNSTADLIAYAKKNPGGLSYGSGGVGSAGHVPMAALASMSGLELTHVPYKGNGPALVDLMSGQIQAMLATIPAVMPFIQQGKLKAIATSGAKRSPVLPDLPTLAEAGVGSFDYAPWYGFFAPRGTPPAVMARLHDAINKVLQDPEVAGKLAQQGLEVRALSQQEFAAMVARDTAAWSRRIKTLGIAAT